MSVKNVVNNQEIDLTTSDAEVIKILGQESIYEVSLIPPDEDDEARETREPPKKIQKLEDAILAQPQLPPGLEIEEEVEDEEGSAADVEIVDPMSKLFAACFDGTEISGQVVS